MKLLVKFDIKLLNHFNVRSNLYSRASLLNECSSNFTLIFSNIMFPVKMLKFMSLPEQKLSVEICDVNLVKVNYMNVLEAAESQILQNLTAKTSSS